MVTVRSFVRKVIKFPLSQSSPHRLQTFFFFFKETRGQWSIALIVKAVLEIGLRFLKDDPFFQRERVML